MTTTAALLAVFAALLAWPVPVLFSRAHWPSAHPAIALILWQAIALGGGLAMIVSLIGLGLSGFGQDLPAALTALFGGIRTSTVPSGFGVVQIALLSFAALLTLDLVANLIDTAVRTERERRRHRDLIALLGSESLERPGTSVLAHPTPVAYCLPGMRTVTVLSAGLIEMLEADELEAVIAHERTHLRQYHHLMLLAFRAWRAALPWFPIASRAERSVSVLVEMLADDAAAKEKDRGSLHRAIARIGAAWEAPDAAGGSVGSLDAGVIAARAGRLTEPAAQLGRIGVASVLLTSIAIVALPAAYFVALI